MKIYKKENVFRDTYSYSIDTAASKKVSVDEYKDGEFNGSEEFKSRERAVKYMMFCILRGGTAVDIITENEYHIHFKDGSGKEYRYDKILHRVELYKTPEGKE